MFAATSLSGLFPHRLAWSNRGALIWEWEIDCNLRWNNCQMVWIRWSINLGIGPLMHGLSSPLSVWTCHCASIFWCGSPPLTGMHLNRVSSRDAPPLYKQTQNKRKICRNSDFEWKQMPNFCTELAKKSVENRSENKSPAGIEPTTSV